MEANNHYMDEPPFIVMLINFLFISITSIFALHVEFTQVVTAVDLILAVTLKAIPILSFYFTFRPKIREFFKRFKK